MLLGLIAMLCDILMLCCWAHDSTCLPKQEMDAELERYHKSCAALDLNASEGRLKQNALHKELARQRTQTQSAQQAIRCGQHSTSSHV